MMKYLRSIKNDFVTVIIYIVDNTFVNCQNELINGSITCIPTNHIIYPINRLRNNGINAIRGFVIDVDADIIPSGICLYHNYK